ncbi:hypothetical protein [Hydrogenophaga sp. NFH-34]|uniref:hypothetical protein n=1 Tax=Hydrogenophaga sp. NFH-34 TaxID=2744446 RepID=UPI001F15AC28|nr:hypothetical protein [Hydrogenophaga sp. NFH-34]
MFKQITRVLALAFAAVLMVGCAAPNGSAPRPSILTSAQGTSTAYKAAQQMQRVEEGVVISVRDITMIDQPASMGQKLGGTLGGAAGYFSGKQFTKNKTVQAVLAGLGGMVGAEYGKQATGTVDGQEIVIRIDGSKYQPSRTVAIAQSSADGVRFHKNQRVLIIGQGRVAPL